MGVDLSILDLVHVEPILVGLNIVEVNVVDTILCRTYSVCRLDLILQVLLCAPPFSFQQGEMPSIWTKQAKFTLYLAEICAL